MVPEIHQQRASPFRYENLLSDHVLFQQSSYSVWRLQRPVLYFYSWRQPNIFRRCSWHKKSLLNQQRLENHNTNVPIIKIHRNCQLSASLLWQNFNPKNCIHHSASSLIGSFHINYHYLFVSMLTVQYTYEALRGVTAVLISILLLSCIDNEKQSSRSRIKLGWRKYAKRR